MALSRAVLLLTCLTAVLLHSSSASLRPGQHIIDKLTALAQLGRPTSTTPRPQRPTVIIIPTVIDTTPTDTQTDPTFNAIGNTVINTPTNTPTELDNIGNTVLNTPTVTATDTETIPVPPAGNNNGGVIGLLENLEEGRDEGNAGGDELADGNNGDNDENNNEGIAAENAVNGMNDGDEGEEQGLGANDNRNSESSVRFRNRRRRKQQNNSKNQLIQLQPFYRPNQQNQILFNPKPTLRDYQRLRRLLNAERKTTLRLRRQMKSLRQEIKKFKKPIRNRIKPIRVIQSRHSRKV